jgi:activator of HSP90 ATPase
MNAWIYDKLTWEDVYPVKDYDYLFIAAQGESPIYSKELGRWSSKAEIDKVNAEINAKEFAAKVTPQPQDFSQYVVNTGAAQAFNSQNVAVNNSANPTSMFEQTTVKVPISELPTMGMQTPTYNSASSYNNSSDDDLPF